MNEENENVTTVVDGTLSTTEPENTVESEVITETESAGDEAIVPNSTVNVVVQSSRVPVTTRRVDVAEEAPREGLAGVVEALLGEYTPRTETVTTYMADGTVFVEDTQIIPGVAGMDVPWLSALLLFSVMLYGLLRLIGVLVKW